MGLCCSPPTLPMAHTSIYHQPRPRPTSRQLVPLQSFTVTAQQPGRSTVILTICDANVPWHHSRGNAGYCATKGWMKDFTEALYLELKATRSAVKMQALCPG